MAIYCARAPLESPTVCLDQGGPYMSHNEKRPSTDVRPHGHRDRGVSNEQLGKKHPAKATSTL
jgi:hypothetical protein